MRILKVTPKNLHFFGSYLTKEEIDRLKTARAKALGAVAGIVPCAVVLFTAEAGEVYLEKMYVEEGFRRRGVATGLIGQIGKSFPGSFKMTCSYQQDRCPEFDGFLKNRKDFSFAGEGCPVYTVDKEEAEKIKLPESNVEISGFFDMEVSAAHRFLKTAMTKSGEEIDGLLTNHAWEKKACLCHADGERIDACLLTERTAEGLRLYYAYSGEGGAPAFLACFKKILKMVEDGEYPVYEIVCRTKRAWRIFAKLLSGRKPDGYLMTAYKYL